MGASTEFRISSTIWNDRYVFSRHISSDLPVINADRTFVDFEDSDDDEEEKAEDKNALGHKKKDPVVRADASFVVTHSVQTDVAAKNNQWLRPSQLRLQSVPNQWRQMVKCVALMTEFKVSL